MKVAPDDCALCPNLVAGRRCIVHGQGSNGGIMVVGQHASDWEDQNGFPFAGKPGQMLRHFLDNAGIHTSQVYRTNVLKCATPGGKKQRKPTMAELSACRAYLMEEIRQVQPKVIVTLGDAALQALYTTVDPEIFRAQLDAWAGDCGSITYAYERELEMWTVADKADRKLVFPAGKPRKPKMPPKPKPPKAQHVALKDVAGHTLVADTGIPMIATYHPSFISRGKWGYLEPVAAHFKKARRLLDGTQKVGKLGDYAVIGDLDQLEALRDYLLSPEVETIWFDCETFGGLDWMENEVLCFSFAGQAGEGYVVPLWHNPGTGKPEIWPEWESNGLFKYEVYARLREIFESDKDKGGHNVLYDIRETERDAKHSFMGKVLTAWGIKVNGRIIDTELESVAVEESLPHNMTFMLANKTDMPFYESEIGAFKKVMEKVDNNVVWAYSAADADGLPRLHEPLHRQIIKEGVGWVLDNITTPMLKVCRTLETNGFPLDMPHFQALSMFYNEQIVLEEGKLWFTVPHLQPGWKYNHSPTLAKVLFQDLKLPPSGRKTEAGKGCEDCDAGDCDLHDQTGRAALEDIQLIQPHPVLPILLRLKKLTKMRSTYLDGSDGKSGLVKHIRADGRVHPTMKISRAETGRLASEKPNAQNLPNYVHIHPAGATCSEVGCAAFYDETFGIDSENAYHDVVKSDKPGWWIMNADWSQAEVWVLAYRLLDYTGDRTLLDVLLSGVDIHLWMAREMFPEVSPTMDDGEWKKTYPNLRRRAKTCMPPETRVLTGDLRWAPLGSLKVGDAIVSLDEEGTKQTFRRLRRGYVTGVSRSQKPLFEVEFDDGTIIKTTDDHPFLTRRRVGGDKANFKWMSLAAGLKRGLKVLPVWEEDASRDAGWLAGYFDGEGCLAQLNHHGAWAVSANQVSGPISDKAYRVAAERGFMVSRVNKPHGSYGLQPIEEVKILGGIEDRLRFLGSVRPERLLNKFEGAEFYGRLPGSDAEIIRVVPIGMGEVVSLETDTHTFIAEGMAVHNCIFGIGYGLTPTGYMQREHCTEEEAEDIINRYMARIPGLRKLFAMVRHHLETQGYEANEFGRRRHITSLPLLQMLRERGELEKLVREAINFPIQSGASDLHSIATYATWLSMQGTPEQINEAISKWFVNFALGKYEIDMILTVHDSLSFEFKYENDQQAETIARIIKDMWESIAWGIVKEDGTPLHWKIPVECEWGETWGTPKYKVDARGTLQLQENLVEEKETYDQKFGDGDDNKPSLVAR